MQNKIILLFFKCIICCCFCELIDALAGRNVLNATEGEFRNVVCIARLNNNNTDLRQNVACTGTLITLDHVLTSEHCFNNMGIQGLYVLVGSIDIRQSVPHYIAWWITHNLWAAHRNINIEFFINDILIIKLIEKVSESILPALLSPEDNNNLYGFDITLAGWGKLEDDSNPYILHKVQTRIISNEDCERIAYNVVGRHVPIFYRYLCSLAVPWALINAGDSGGPAFFGSFLIGINQGTCPKTNVIIDPRKANLHCTVDYYRIFITDNMRL